MTLIPPKKLQSAGYCTIHAALLANAPPQRAARTPNHSQESADRPSLRKSPLFSSLLHA